MPSTTRVFAGCMPALMTPCSRDGAPDYAALATTGRALVERGMRAVVWCGSMGDWPLLSDTQRMLGVEALVDAGVPVVVGTGAQNTARAAALAAHARDVGALGLMLIPRVLSRTASPVAQRNHYATVLAAADGLPSVIYNSPYYGFETKADLFFELRRAYPHLAGFKEFGGASSLSYAAEHICNAAADIALMVGVDTQVVHGYVRCGAAGAITGVGNALPREILRLIELCTDAAGGDVEAYRLAVELEDALQVLAGFDEGPDLVLYYKRLMVLEGHSAYRYHVGAGDDLSASQQAYVDAAWQRFRGWWNDWPGKGQGD
jgi:1-pyrroline-4-hydroxy-2-carboxylate deaminase